MLREYFIPYETKNDINYIYLLKLYKIAEYDIKTGKYNLIRYSSIKNLSELLEISISTIQRILKDKAYNNYFSIDKEKKIIYLNNYIKNFSKKQFVVLSSA